MLIYEVNLEVDYEIIEEFKNWLPGHVAEMLQIPGFLGAEISTDITNSFADGGASNSSLKRLNAVKNIIVHYKVESKAALEEYFLSKAGQMRAPAVRQFGAKFRAQRRVLKLGLP